MMHEVRFPKFGMSTVEVDVTEMMISVGMRLEVGVALLEVETDKVTTVMESEVAGIVQSIHVEVGGTYEVGDLICQVTVTDD